MLVKKKNMPSKNKNFANLPNEIGMKVLLVAPSTGFNRLIFSKIISSGRYKFIFITQDQTDVIWAKFTVAITITLDFGNLAVFKP